MIFAPLLHRKMRDAKNAVVLVMAGLGLLLLLTAEAVSFIEHTY